MEFDKNNKIEKVLIGGKKISIGLDWDVLKGTTSQSKEISALLKQQGNTDVRKGIIIKSSEEISSTGIGLIHGKEKLYGKSGAAWLSDAYKHGINQAKKSRKKEKLDEDLDDEFPAWIVIEKLEEGNDKYWVTIIKDGIPLPGTDIVESFYNVVDRLNDFFSAAKDISVYTTDSAILEEVSNLGYMVQGNLTVEKKSFSEIVNKVRCTKYPSNLKGLDPKILGIAALVIVAGAGYYFWSSYQEEEAMRMAAQQQQATKQAQQQASLKLQKDYEDLKAKTLSQTVEKAKYDLNSILSTSKATDVLNEWSDLIYQVKMSHSGWEMDNISCSVESATPQCVVNLNRGELGINRSLMQDFPTAIINGDKALYVLKGTALNTVDGDYKLLPNTDDFKVDILSDLQLLKFGEIKHAIDASKEVTQNVNLPDAPAGITQDMNVSPIKMGVSYGNMHLEGTDIWQLKGVAPVLDSRGLTVQSMTVTLDKEFKASAWKIEGIYYVKTGDVVIPVIPPSKIAGIN